MVTFNRSIIQTAAIAILLGSSAIALPAYANDTNSTAPAAQAAVSATAHAKAEHEKVDPEEEMKKRVEVRIKTLHDELKITKDQDEKWESVAQTMRDNEANVAQLVETREANIKNMSAIEDIKSYQGIARARAEGLSKFIEAFEPFYNGLTDDQKKTADAFFSEHQ